MGPEGGAAVIALGFTMITALKPPLKINDSSFCVFSPLTTDSAYANI